MNDLETEDGVDRLAQPEKTEIKSVVTGEPIIITITTASGIIAGEIAGEPKGKDDDKNRNLRQQEQEKYWKLLVHLTAPEDHGHRRLQNRLRAPQTKYDAGVA
jgi:hypothetical protein